MHSICFLTFEEQPATVTFCLPKGHLPHSFKCPGHRREPKTGNNKPQRNVVKGLQQAELCVTCHVWPLAHALVNRIFPAPFKDTTPQCKLIRNLIQTEYLGIGLELANSTGEILLGGGRRPWEVTEKPLTVNGKVGHVVSHQNLLEWRRWVTRSRKDTSTIY